MERRNVFLTVGVILVTSLVFICASFADEESEAILKILIKKGILTAQEVEEMKAEVRKEKTVAKVEPPKGMEERIVALEEKSKRLDLDKITSKLKLKGRYAAGFYDSGKAGAFPSGSFEAPEAKLQFAFEPDEIHKVIIRLNLNNATFNNLDYFYIDSNLEKLLKLPIPLSSRLGRQKLDIGEETWSDNPVESILPSNSVGRVAGYDEGLQLSGKLGKAKPVGYTFSVTNGTTGTGSDTSTAKAFTGKLFYNILDPLYVSASYYNSGQMKLSNAEVGPGGLVTRPSGALDWRREMWEMDMRYDFKKGKTLNPPAFSDSKGIFRLAYGSFSDDVSGPAAERTGHYGFVDGIYNLTPKFYVASRISQIAFDNDVTAALSGVTANEFQRYSLGLGYRLTSATLLKLSYDWNQELGAATDNANNDLLSAIIASQF